MVKKRRVIKRITRILHHPVVEKILPRRILKPQSKPSVTESIKERMEDEMNTPEYRSNKSRGGTSDSGWRNT